MIVECVEKTVTGPPALVQLASCAVAGQIVSSLWKGKLEFHQTYIPEPLERCLKEWVEGLPTVLRQGLLQRSSRSLLLTIGRLAEMSSSTVPIMLAALLEVLYCPGLGDVEVWTDLHWHQEARMKVLHLLHSTKSSVKRLSFSCYKTPIFQFQALPFSERFLLTNVFNKFPSLVHLSLPYVADDSLLARLGSGVCPNLQSLDIQGSWEVTDQGISALAGKSAQMVIGRVGWVPSHFAQCSEGQKLLGDILKGSPVQASLIAELAREHSKEGLAASLMSLGVESTAVSSQGLQTALQSFPRLRRLEAEERHWQELLVELGSQGKGCRDCYPAHLPLTCINLARHTYSLMEPLANLLPNLEKITMSNYERSEAYLDGEDNLPILGAFPHLTYLVLQDVEMEPVFRYLGSSSVGRNIKGFCYRSRHKQIELAYLDVVCPNLRELEVEESLVKFTPSYGSLDTGSFPRLTFLSLRDVTFEGDQACWRRMIKRCLGLQRLTLQNVRLNDADMADLLVPPSLSKLEEINISSTGTTSLTEDTVFKLLNNCPRLRRVGGVCGWSCSDLLNTLEKLSSSYHFKIKMDDQAD